MTIEQAMNELAITLEGKFIGKAYQIDIRNRRIIEHDVLGVYADIFEEETEDKTKQKRIICEIVTNEGYYVDIKELYWKKFEAKTKYNAMIDELIKEKIEELKKSKL